MGLEEDDTGRISTSGVPEVKEEDLFHLDARLARNYLNALDSIGVAAPEGYDSLAAYVSEHPVDLAIDSTGYAPALASLLGEGYMGDALVLVSAGQFRDSRGNVNLSQDYRRNSGLADALERATGAYRNLVISCLPSEAVVVSVRQTLAGKGGSYDLGLLLESLSTGTMQFSLLEKRMCTHELVLDAETPEGSVGKARGCMDLLSEMDTSSLDDFLLGERRQELEKAAEDMAALGQYYDKDDLYRLARTETKRRFPLERPFRYRTLDPDGRRIIVDVVPSQEAFIVLVTGRIRIPKDPPIPIIPRSDKGRLLDSLYGAGYVHVEKEKALDMLHARGVDVLRELAYPEEELEHYEANPVMLYHELGKDEVKEHLTDEWFALRDMYLMLRGAESDCFPAREKEKLGRLYARLSPESKLGASVLSGDVDDRTRSMIVDWLPEMA